MWYIKYVTSVTQTECKGKSINKTAINTEHEMNTHCLHIETYWQTVYVLDSWHLDELFCFFVFLR